MNIEELENKHINKDCVILTCGPSLKEYSKKKILEFCNNKIVICVKEAIIEYEDIADYFLYNGCRERPYYITKNIIKIYSASKNQPKTPCDIFLKENISEFQPEKQILCKQNFDDYNFKNNKLRPWGPGIMYESGFYLALYMGIKNVYTIGWDLIDTTNTYKITHFFDDDNSNKYKESGHWNNRNWLGEMEMVNRNIPYMYEYFKSQNMLIHVVGEQSFVNRDIPRIFI
jgi:hypothetical protein